jgi:hypothetical protein
MAGGTYAEFITIDADKIAAKPKSVGHVEAASLALVALTALPMLERAGVNKSQIILIRARVERRWRRQTDRTSTWYYRNRYRDSGEPRPRAQIWCR